MGRGAKVIAFAGQAAGIVIGGLFVYAGMLKAADPGQFAEDIGNYRLLPHVAGVALALYLPWLEIACGAALVIGKGRRGALALLASLCVVFLVALASAWMRGLDISCGCFGHSQPHPLNMAMLLDVVLLVALCVLMRLEFKPRGGA